ncbi:hypothetical protein K9O30_14975 [Clostridium bowmanii]|uniref:hypothetical protein n=1 Tax=Clostridium bowmanii TaxID=132925 RepID=UPI001C0C556B|nr:hypothetical protein [Clostridium bowmanii]MBU3190754.1 hypothetical protein [Clostridium bowmanii]MCA1075000.1 hypothetical protein [Clostridium bowmanii]
MAGDNSTVYHIDSSIIQVEDDKPYVRIVPFKNGGYLYFKSEEPIDYAHFVNLSDQDGKFWSARLSK